jgi:beta-lactamase superfamily II metal-dependent hydrolase
VDVLNVQSHGVKPELTVPLLKLVSAETAVAASSKYVQ